MATHWIDELQDLCRSRGETLLAVREILEGIKIWEYDRENDFHTCLLCSVSQGWPYSPFEFKHRSTCPANQILEALDLLPG